jgi:predicted 3-demethylubiquinone-9 3-methyltransferase (glyoxalase superfamily)
MPMIHKLIPCLWFNGQAEDAAKLYVSIFDRSRIGRISHYGKEGQEVHGRQPGSVLTVEFELEGQPFTALNGGPQFTFTPAISLQVMCETQDEIDRYWKALSAGGDERAQQCGWLADKFGLSWQIVPAILASLMTDRDPAKVDRVMKALLPMKKLDIAKLQSSASGVKG